MSTVTRTVRVGTGVFAPGHLGELTQQVPFEMVDEVLVATGAVQRRVRLLPSRVVVYLLLAGVLFAELGYVQVWGRLTAGLGGSQPAPSGAALAQARRRLGVAPLKALFELLRGPAATLGGAARWRGLLVCAVDGTVMSVADSPANRVAYPQQRGSAFPMLRLVAVVACGTRSVLDAAFGPACGTGNGETAYAARLLGALGEQMIVLADRGFAAGWLVKQIADTGAHLLIRVKNGRSAPKLPALHRLPDGSFISRHGGIKVRVIDAGITVSTAAGPSTGSYRLITTLLDPVGYPATDLVRLYHQRWEIETAYLELKSSILGGRVLRARTPAGTDQEIYALLIVHQALRTAMADATNSDPRIAPDRAGFSIALAAARDQVIQAAGVIADTTIDLTGRIGRAVLDNLLPDRRMRTNARTVKRAISKYNARGPAIDRTTYQATIAIDILTPTNSTTAEDP
ncbi:IS4 family transposase [Actinomadura geliboluensis]|uniref:IS4 family transposase n=1 Tax=Actinomadura geliboluensis TaxID=882440 RepID=A0A5S4FPK9_9ACTN|nr:IS4 family transposase [Actinomadura geliboluensis]